MKYIIKNKQLFNSIYTFMNREFENIYWGSGYDYTRNEETDDLIYFRIPDYDGNIFELTKDTWYTRVFEGGETREPKEFVDKWLPLSPVLHFIDEGIRTEKKFNSLFGDYWKPVFEKWFEDKFPQFIVKTFVY